MSVQTSFDGTFQLKNLQLILYNVKESSVKVVINKPDFDLHKDGKDPRLHHAQYYEAIAELGNKYTRHNEPKAACVAQSLEYFPYIEL